MATKKTAEEVPAAKQEGSSMIPWDKSESTGFENVQAQDLGIPFLVIVQKGSPEIDPTHKMHADKRIAGAEVGCIINTISREILYKPGGPPLSVIPVHWDKLYVEWKPRNSGGGVVKAHRDETILSTCKRSEKNQDILPNGNVLVTTAYFYVVRTPASNNEELEQMIVGMSSTQLKKSRVWLNMAQAIKVRTPSGARITPPLFSHNYRLSTGPESNDKGSWMGWKIEAGPMLQDLGLVDEVVAVNNKLRANPIAALPAPPDAEDDVM